MAKTILIAGIGNIFLGDDGFGSEVARRLASRSWPAGVRVVDYGIRGFDVAFALMVDGDDVAIIIETRHRKAVRPERCMVIEPDLAELNDPEVKELPVDVYTRDATPMKVFQPRPRDGRPVQ